MTQLWLRRNSITLPDRIPSVVSIVASLLILTSCNASKNVAGGASNVPSATQKKEDCCKKDAVVSPAQRDKGVTVTTNTKTVTVVGEVIDAWCYSSGVMGEGRGEAHKKCARLCVSGGVSAGILDDEGNIYIAAKYQGYKGCAGLLLPYVGTRVKAKGWVAERGGVRVMKIGSVEPETKASEKSERPTGGAGAPSSADSTPEAKE